MKAVQVRNNEINIEIDDKNIKHKNKMIDDVVFLILPTNELKKRVIQIFVAARVLPQYVLEYT